MLNIQENIILAPFTTFRIGGPAKYFTEVTNEEDLKVALEYAQKNNLDFFVLGGGSNVLVNDEGYNGLAIKLKTENSEIKIINETLIECWAGETLTSAVSFARENSLTGLEWAAGIPGTIGGAVRGNAGAFGGNIGSIIKSVKAITISNGNFEVKDFTKEECAFGYRSSFFKNNPDSIILKAILKLEKSNESEILNKMNENISKRSKNQPKNVRSVGSFFTNPVVNDPEVIQRFERDSGKLAENNIVAAGWLVEEVGFKGRKIGGAMVSEGNANWIVNTGQATAADIIMLSSLIKQKVRARFKVQLMEEVKFLGF